ncbi:magnesium/cobalt transporter CorA [Saccharicrinis sp. FJH62]|uniref:magnesium/cobalt transporter CorA n=1 Tax=Saccharicrinis sp. FJH62 TaxID=3344657 RepID=UPI0035D51829
MARFLKNRKQSQGTSPGSLIFLGKQKTDKPTIRQMQFDKNTLEEYEYSKISDVKLDDNKMDWVNIDGLHDTKLIEEIGILFGINTMFLEDILNTDQRPKMEDDTNHIFVAMKFVGYDEETKHLFTDQVSFIMGNNYLISFQEKKGTYFDSVRERLRSGHGRLRNMKCDYLLYALMDTIADKYIDTVENIGDKIEGLDKEIFENPNTDIIKSIYSFKTELNYLRKAIRPVKEITNNLLRSESHLLHKKTDSFYRDLDDLVTQSTEALEVYYTMNSDQLNILNTLIGNKTNDVMKVLTIFAAIFIPLTFLAGIYGTNFDYLPELHFKYSYFIMWGVMIIMAGIMLLYFRRKKWL